MNQEKVGKYIAIKRKEKGLTQGELGDKLGVGYKAVSKWETGRTFPDVSILKSLCMELGISINELLNGESEKIEEEAVFDYLKYQNKKYRKKIILFIIGIISLIIVSILTLYFINNYNKIKVYEFSGESEHFSYNNALFIESNMMYFYVFGDIDKSLGEESMKKILYTELRSGDKLIFGGGNISNGYLCEHYGYDELFPREVVENIDNWNLRILYKDDDEIKWETLNLTKKGLITNTHFLPTKVEPISSEPTEEEKTSYAEWEEKLKKQEEKAILFAETHGYKQTEIYDKDKLDIAKTLKLPTMYQYNKQKEDSTSWKIQILHGIVTISYVSDDYSVFSHSVGSRYFGFVSGEGEDRFNYLYNGRDDRGRCSIGNCPEDFIETARDFVKMYEEEFDGLYYYSENEFPVDYDEIENPNPDF